MPRKEAARPDYVALAELHQGMVALGDRIDAHFLALCEKIETFTSSIQAHLTQIEEANFFIPKHFLPSQLRWADDPASLKIENRNPQIA